MNSFEVFCVALHEQSNNQTKKPKNSSKDLNGENLDKAKFCKPLEPMAARKHDLQRGICSISKRCATAVDAYTDTANQVAHADRNASPEQRVSGELVGSREDELWI